MTDLRILALGHAIQSKGDDTPANVVKRAESFLTFLSAGVATAAITAPTPTASPLAEPNGTEPARLDDPKIVAETEKVVADRPTLIGEDASSTDGGQAETQPAAQVEKSAPAADVASAPPVAEVNAAVLAYNRANGREKTLALLGKFGGSKVPEIDASKHAELLVELKAGV